MSTKWIVGIFLITVFFVGAQPVSANDAPRASLWAQIVALRAQIAMLESRVATVEASSLLSESVFTDKVDVLVRYRLAGVGATQSIQDLKQRIYFTRVLQLFPEPYRSRVQELTVFTGEDAPYDAYVETIPPEHTLWRYGVHEDLLAYSYDEIDTELVVHELGHMVSYESMLGIPQPRVSRCHEYFVTSSCPSRGSYLSEFVRRFWSDGDLDRVLDTDSYQEAERYYNRHTDEYVSDYAAQNPEEDFSESFMFFMLDMPVDGEMAKEKVAFLVQMKNCSGLKQR